MSYIDGPIYLSASMLEAMSCSTKAVLRYVLHYTDREERAELNAGSAVDKAVSAWFEGKRRNDCLGIFNTEYHAWATENVADDDRLSYSNVYKVLSTWLDNHPIESFPFRVRKKNIQVAFSFPINDEFVWGGRMDLLADDLRDSHLYVVDTKTTGRISHYWARKFRLSAQITGYIWAAQQHTSETNVTGAYINAIELSKLPSDPSRKCKDHAVPYIECGHLHAKAELIGPFTRTPHQIEEFKKTAIHLGQRYKSLLQRFGDVKRLHKVRTQGAFHNDCPFCPFYEFCANDRPIEHVDSYLQKVEREPFVPTLSRGSKARSSRLPEGLNDSYGQEPLR